MLEIRNIQKTYGSQTALSGIDLSIAPGEFFSLLGPSGCGKSTLLRILAGLEEASGGEILWQGQRIDGLPARSRPFNMVFQKYALFPHLSVFENVAFGLRVKKAPQDEVVEKVEAALKLVNLSGFARRLPETLSGGQAQRVALARALVNRPACLLLDEPLTALDQKLREHMRTELRDLQRQLGLTFIFVTHDQEEAMLMSDRIAVMNQGRIEQVSSPIELFQRPHSLFSARFIGNRNEIAGRVSGAANRKPEALEFHIEGLGALHGVSRCERLNQSLANGAAESVQIFIRPERLQVSRANSSGATRPSVGPTGAGVNCLTGRVQNTYFRGLQTDVALSIGQGLTLRASLETDRVGEIRIGDQVSLEFPHAETHLFFADPS
jgi:spermidine/putrescine transport system ATP-binding protein